MIKLEKTQVVGWEPAIRGMRNPMNSWDKSDTVFCDYEMEWRLNNSYDEDPCTGLEIGPADHKLMMRLASNGPVHAKYRRMINVYVDITAPLYWWKEFDTYKVGTVANSCSTMHKIHERNLELSDFSCEHLDSLGIDILTTVIEQINNARLKYIGTYDDGLIHAQHGYGAAYIQSFKKNAWWQMIQLLPSSYNQKRTVMMNYEVLAHIYPDRLAHKLDEWREFCHWIKSLPYSELITDTIVD